MSGEGGRLADRSRSWPSAGSMAGAGGGPGLALRGRQSSSQQRSEVRGQGEQRLTLAVLSDGVHDDAEVCGVSELRQVHDGPAVAVQVCQHRHAWAATLGEEHDSDGGK